MQQGGIFSLSQSSTVDELLLACIKRITGRSLPPNKRLQFPVGLLFVRGDRAGDGKALADQAIASFGYWHKDSAETFDIVFVGWSCTENETHFHLDEFLKFKQAVESTSTWDFSGETDLLLLNFEVDLNTSRAKFDYTEAIVLRIEAMLRDKQAGSLDGLLAELISASRSVSPATGAEGDSPIWQISDQIGYLRAKRGIWQVIKKIVLRDSADTVSAIENFAVQDIEQAGGSGVLIPSPSTRDSVQLLTR
jgi:hypothetical protein